MGGNDNGMFHGELLLKPSPNAVLDNILPDCVMGYIYGALIEAFCSEQSARMMAMEAANKSAAEMIHDLSIEYNRVRQAMITQEITEVISGAKAQKKRRRRRKGGKITLDKETCGIRKNHTSHGICRRTLHLRTMSFLILKMP